MVSRVDNEEHISIHCCFRCYIFLGDLIRYHRDLLDEKQRKKWLDSYLFYKKAMYLIPDNGNPHNQMAVLATYRDDEFEAVYRYYRSLAVNKPFFTAKENLITLFRKNVIKFQPVAKQMESNYDFSKINRKRNKKGRNSNKENKTKENQELFNYFILGFVRLHGILFTKASLVEFCNLKRNVLIVFENLIKKDYISEELLLRIIVMNIFIFEFIKRQKKTELMDHLSSPSPCQYDIVVSNFIIEMINYSLTRAVRCNNNNTYLGAISTFMEWILCNSLISPSISQDHVTEKQKSPHLDSCTPSIWKSYIKLTCQLLTSIRASRYLTEGLSF